MLLRRPILILQFVQSSSLPDQQPLFAPEPTITILKTTQQTIGPVALDEWMPVAALVKQHIQMLKPMMLSEKELVHTHGPSKV
jgi:hypothetical protein